MRQLADASFLSEPTSPSYANVLQVRDHQTDFEGMGHAHLLSSPRRLPD